VPAQEPPLVSIVTPSLNQGRYLGETIASVAAQDYPRVEHIVVDGGSTDETRDVLRGHADVRWVSERDSGQSDAVNKGFRMAQGAVFGWLNADDLYLPGAISAAVARLQETGAGLVYGGWRQIDEDGTTLKEVAPKPFDLHQQLEVANRVAQPAAFFTREAFEAVGGLDETYNYAMDYELWLKLGERFPVAHVEQTLAAFRFHGESKTVADSHAFAAETWRAARAHGARRRSPLYVDFYLPRERPRLYRLVLAGRLLRRGDLRGLLAGVKRRVTG